MEALGLICTLSIEVGEAALVVATALGLVGQGLDDAIVGGVLGEVLKPQQGSALALKDVGDPAEGVIEVPESDADAAADLDASANNLFAMSATRSG
jgi:hypothetical protein